MLALAMKIIVCLLLAALLGFIIGYLLGRIRKCEDEDINNQQQYEPNYAYESDNENEINQEETIDNVVDEVDSNVNYVIEQEQESETVVEKPKFLDKPNGEPDDLKMVKGIGPMIEKMLNEIGIYHFYQIANLTDEDIKKIDDYLVFKGRITRENWIEQAAQLQKGIETEFSKRAKRTNLYGK